MIELYELRQFAAFAGCGTLSEAANILHLSQPALSRNMKKLEEEMGIMLFTRSKNRLELNEKSVSAAVIVIYVLSTLVGGIVIGKLAKVRRFLWGLLLGGSYFTLLMLITLGVYHTLSGDGVHFLTTFVLCAGGGMAGMAGAYRRS